MSNYLESFADHSTRQIAAESKRLREFLHFEVRPAMLKRLRQGHYSALAQDTDMDAFQLPAEYDGAIVRIYDQRRKGHLVVRLPYSERPDLYEAKWKLEAAGEMFLVAAAESDARDAARVALRAEEAAYVEDND